MRGAEPPAEGEAQDRKHPLRLSVSENENGGGRACLRIQTGCGLERGGRLPPSYLIERVRIP